MIKIYGSEEGYARAIPYKQSIFPGGEIFIRVEELQPMEFYLIEAELRSATDIIELFMITDALRRISPEARIHLEIPYMPYARQDRVCNPGEAFSLEVFVNLIKAQNYSSVSVWDVHSIIAHKLMPDLIEIPQVNLVEGIITKNTILVAPDKGALPKIWAIAEEWDLDVVTATKIRDPLTTKIISTEIEIDTDKLYERYLIVDDIADGGRTFVELAKVMRSKGVKHIELYVTHGIFSQGLSVFNGLIDKIYCPNPWIEFSELEKFNNG